MNHPLLPEYALRQLWQRQQFSHEGLRTVDGRPVLILSPGRPNDDGGPDFTDARIRIGNISFAGDVELHVDAAGWLHHRHGGDPRYNSVILHVVLAAGGFTPAARTASRRTLPLLVLQPFLAPGTLRALAAELSETPERQQRVSPCRTHTSDAVAMSLGERLHRMGMERMAIKIGRYEERLKQLADERARLVCEPYTRYYGSPEEIPLPEKSYTQRDFAVPSLWDQLLYEGIMDGLGYEKNRAPFLRLARTVTLDTLRAHGLGNTPTIMALLFGVAGLLPPSQHCRDTEGRRYLRALRRRWRELQHFYRGPRFHEADWTFFRLRPANFPTLRLASCCFLLDRVFHGSGMARIVNAFGGATPRQRLRLVTGVCGCTMDDFWSYHYHFHTRTTRKITGLGRPRINQLVLNALIPITLLYARIFGDNSLHDAAVETLDALPPQQEDWILRTMRQRLPVDPVILGSAIRQQGAMHLYATRCCRQQCRKCPVKEVSVEEP